ncbi:uncharacterized protein LOC102806321 [Saccoglossus kowalevskii]
MKPASADPELFLHVVFTGFVCTLCVIYSDQLPELLEEFVTAAVTIYFEAVRVMVLAMNIHVIIVAIQEIKKSDKKRQAPSSLTQIRSELGRPSSNREEKKSLTSFAVFIKNFIIEFSRMLWDFAGRSHSVNNAESRSHKPADILARLDNFLLRPPGRYQRQLEPIYENDFFDANDNNRENCTRTALSLSELHSSDNINFDINDMPDDILTRLENFFQKSPKQQSELVHISDVFDHTSDIHEELPESVSPAQLHYHDTMDCDVNDMSEDIQTRLVQFFQRPPGEFGQKTEPVYIDDSFYYSDDICEDLKQTSPQLHYHDAIDCSINDMSEDIQTRLDNFLLRPPGDNVSTHANSLQTVSSPHLHYHDAMASDDMPDDITNYDMPDDITNYDMPDDITDYDMPDNTSLLHNSSFDSLSISTGDSDTSQSTEKLRSRLWANFRRRKVFGKFRSKHKGYDMLNKDEPEDASLNGFLETE